MNFGRDINATASRKMVSMGRGMLGLQFELLQQYLDSHLGCTSIVKKKKKERKNKDDIIFFINKEGNGARN